MDMWEAFYGPNAGYAQELYERYQEDPQSVDPASRAFFDRLSVSTNGDVAPGESPGTNGASPPTAASSALLPPDRTSVEVQKVVGAARLARSIREYGHLAARLDPLGEPGPGDPMLDPATHNITREDLEALPPSIVWPSAGPEIGTCWDAIERLREMYSGPIGYDFDHVNDYDERLWLHAQAERLDRPELPDEDRRLLLRRLSQVEGFERYLHTAFPGQKRFSIEGNDTLVPMLDLLIRRAIEIGTREVLLGMAHRGRLNVLAHILGKPYSAILAQFQSPTSQPGTAGDAIEVTNPGWTGDVKYHMGGRLTVRGEVARAEVTLADNPSHLEVVDPVVEGFARAAQDDRHLPGPPCQDVDRALPVTIHGDAAFPGEGVVAETLNLSRLPGYATGGTIRFIVNNQIGFTTGAEEGRSTVYASDLAKGFEIPILHVNADVPEACLWAVELAHAYRERFEKDILIDLIGYRRWGHNEGDEPGFTQPQLYKVIQSHPTVRALYAQDLEARGIIQSGEAQAMLDEVREELQRAREDQPADGTPEQPLEESAPLPIEEIPTAVPEQELRELHEALLDFPDEFTINPRLTRILQRRRGALDVEHGIDWSLGESLALASILADGTPIRLTGQDAQRGTFSHRHAVLVDPNTGAQHVPLQRLPQARASFAIYNSPLTETATLGFEYGYSVHAQEALVLWEAQFGDFANVAQVIMDQFISSARAKWRRQPANVLLLPHGYEGQGPEHSSGRIERYLQLAAENNLRVANCTTPAQYFHLLRIQAATLSSDRRPLVLMTPKSLLRHPRASSSLEDLAQGCFHPVLDDPAAATHAGTVGKVVLASGKVAIDLLGAVEERKEERVAVLRLELLYPFPARDVRRLLSRYSAAREIVWVQEEPRNMGAWAYVEPRLREALPDGCQLRYVGRPERAATAEGSAAAHAREQARILAEALDVDDIITEQKQRGVQHVG